MKKLVNLWILLSFFSLATAQEQCGTDQLMMRNPFLMETYNSRVACDAPEINLDTAQVLTIPVVFHILHLGEPIGEETNISDEQILSCIENLNHRFRGDVEALAALTDEYDEYELSLIKDAKIEFCLASRDPNNESTDGINRYDCSNLTNNGESYALDGIASDGTQDGVADSYIKNLFHWPEDKYFNCYVVSEIAGNNGNNGTQGYSFVGSIGLGATGYRYGPVCLYNVTGTTGTLKAGRELNATWAHEVGHALNLFHTFNFSSGDCFTESNPCTQGDQCPDTPQTSANNAGCSLPQCPGAMVENYMDYTPETCKTAFSQNQIERMRHEIYTELDYLININNVSCQSPNSRDIAITSVSVPSDWCLETIDFNVKINNFGGEIAEEITLLVNNILYEVPSIEAGEYVLISVNNFVLGDGTIEIEVLYDLDEFLDNNTLTQIVEVIEQNWLEVILSPDVWSNEIDWEVINEFGEVMLSGGDYPVQTSDIDYYEATCLPDGCYTFKITDSAGDGMCTIDFDGDGICDATYDSFINIFVNNNLTYELSDPQEMDFGSILEVDFCTIYCPSEGCEGDFDGDGVVGIQDLLTFLATPQGSLNDCSEFDFNNDLQIDLNDVLDLLSIYGTNCFTGANILGAPPEGILNLFNQEFGLIVTEVTENNINDGICLVGPPLYFDLSGRKINDKARLSPGIYLVVENWSNGTATTRKIFINSWE